jgi:signal transduction histidine kinase
VQDVCQQFAALASVRKITVTPEVAEPRLMTSGSAAMLSMMLGNLVDNAVKYSLEGGQVRVRAWREGSSVALSVEDDGIGIRPGERERLFARFFRGDQARAGNYAGAGLGLAKVLSIVKAHGGSIEVSGEAGRGARFDVRLPAVAG